MNIRHSLAAVVLLAVGASVAPAAPPSPEVTHLVYALPVTVPAALAYIAFDKGYWKEEGLDVEAKMFSSGREALQMLLAGQAQLQSVSETPIVHAVIQGNDVVTVATIAEHAEAKILARKDHGIAKPSDLRGKKVATLPGTNSDYFMYKFFEKQKIPLDQVQIANMAPPEMIVSLTKGDIDAYFAWEPHIFYGRRELGDKVVEFYPGELYRGFNTLNMNGEFAKKNPNTVRAVLRALLKSEAFVRAHPDEAAELVAKRLNMQPDVVKTLMKENVYKLELHKRLPPLMNSIGRWALDQKGLSKDPLPDFRSHIDDGPLRQEKPSAVTL